MPGLDARAMLGLPMNPDWAAGHDQSISSGLERIDLLPDAEQLELLLEDVLKDAKRRQPYLRGAL